MSSTEEEQLQTLPVNHPQAGYLSHDRSGVIGTGTVPDDEQAIYDARTEADQAEAEAIAEHENEVATSEPMPHEDEAAAKTTSSKTSSTSSSSSPKSSGE